MSEVARENIWSKAGARSAELSRHLVLVGLNYVGHRATGDKNFWAALVPLLARDFRRITILSVRENDVEQVRERIGDCLVETRFLPPILVKHGRDTKSRKASRVWDKGSYPRILGVVDKQLAVARIARALGDVLREAGAAPVHLMDNFGPANRLLAGVAQRYRSPVTVTAASYDPRGRPLYSQYLRLSYQTSAKAVTLSRAFQRRLHDIGIPAGSMTRIPWGVDPSIVLSDADRRAARTRLGFGEDERLFVWAGFIQQIKEPDFALALEVARSAQRRGVDATFMFAFKPETFRSEYASLHDPQHRLTVMATTVETFELIRKAADVLLSPLSCTGCIVAPPLTWIEFMSFGCPILTTNVPGADEIVIPRHTGVLADTVEDLVCAAQHLRDGCRLMRSACRSKIELDYNLDDISRSYVRLWCQESG